MRLSILSTCIALGLFAQSQHPCATSKQKHHTRSSTTPLDKASNSDYALMNLYDHQALKLDVALSNQNDYISGSATYWSKVIHPLTTYVLELHKDIAVDSILINDTLRSFTRDASTHTLHITMPYTVAVGVTLKAQVFYAKTSTLNGQSIFNGGLTNITSPTYGRRVTYSMSESYSGYLWFPCKQQLLDQLDSVEVWATVDTNLKVGSQGLLKAVTPLGNGKHRFEWKSTYPTDYYLVSVTVSDYVDYSYTLNSIYLPQPLLIQNYVYPNALNPSRAVIDQTGTMIEEFSKHFGAYPFHKEKYGHCMAPLSGGEEHQTMTTIGFFDFDLVSHELAHQWFGNLVTCGTWKDIWINEGFASWGECYMREQVYGFNNHVNYIKEYHEEVLSSSDGMNGSVYFTDTTDESRIFNSVLSYRKPGAVLNTLRYEFNNDSLFYDFIHYYLEQHRFKNATTESFLSTLNTYTGRDYTAFVNQWIYQAGYPIFNIKWNAEADQLHLQVTQSNTLGTSFLYQTPYEVWVSRSNLPDTVIKFRIEAETESFSIPLTGTVTALNADPNYWVLDASYIRKDTNLVVGIDAFEPSSIRLYPNPSHGLMTVSSPNQEIQALYLYTSLGQCISKEQYTPAHQLQLNTSHYESGIYTLIIELSNHKIVPKSILIY